MLDLFSGLGGASEAFVQSRYWEVVRIENNELCADVVHTWHMDVNCFLDLMPLQHYDLIWASPPCTEFSTARQPPIENPSLELIQTTIEIIDALKPTHWIIENVKGAIKHFAPLLGPPRLILGPYCFWGNFPLFHVALGGHTKYLFEGKEPWSDDPLRPQKRAYVPLQISQALKDAIESQSTLESFI